MSVVLASDYRVRDFDRWWAAVRASRQKGLPDLDAHQFVAYRAVDDPCRVFVTLGVRTRHPIDSLLRSAHLADWYEEAGVEDIPPLFIGTPVEKIRLVEDAEAGDTPLPRASVIVASIARIEDFDRYMSLIHSMREEMIAAGTRQHWVYQAVDDPAEVMTLEEVDSLQHALAWLHNRDALEAFLAKAGIGIYPQIFVGKLLDVLDLAPSSRDGGD